MTDFDDTDDVEETCEFCMESLENCECGEDLETDDPSQEEECRADDESGRNG